MLNVFFLLPSFPLPQLNWQSLLPEDEPPSVLPEDEPPSVLPEVPLEPPSEPVSPEDDEVVLADGALDLPFLRARLHASAAEPWATFATTALSAQERADYGTFKACCYSRADAFRAIGRGDLITQEAAE